MAFIPYIHFDGNCDEAMSFYAGVFGATDLKIMRYSEAPEDCGADAALGPGDAFAVHAATARHADGQRLSRRRTASRRRA